MLQEVKEGARADLGAFDCQFLAVNHSIPDGLAGLDGPRITAPSMRAGHATAAALAGVPLDRIAAQTRHKDLRL